MELKTLLENIDLNQFKLTQNDREFAKRVFTTPMEKYSAILDRIGFNGPGRILDAGCGFGQWAATMGLLGADVWGIDKSTSRIEFINEMVRQNPSLPIKAIEGGIDELPYENNFFNKIFCYGAIFISNPQKVLLDFQRVLTPGGTAYITFNSLGFYAYLWEIEPNKTLDYDPREVTVRALANARTYFSNGAKDSIDLCIDPDQMKSMAKEAGLEVMYCGGDGTYNADSTPRHFFQPSYKGLDCVMEILLRKP